MKLKLNIMDKVNVLIERNNTSKTNNQSLFNYSDFSKICSTSVFRYEGVDDTMDRNFFNKFLF